MKPKTFNDTLAIVVIFLFVLLWIGDAILRSVYPNFVGFGEGIMGATISLVTLIVQYYFRRKEPQDEPPK